MAEKGKDVQPPKGLSRVAWRSAIWLYRIGLGSLLGERMLLLNHTGRKSGKLRQAVLEVVEHDTGTGAYIVASGFGEKSDWFKNIIAHPAVSIQVGNTCLVALADRVPLEQAKEIMSSYNRRHPKLLRSLAGGLGYRSDGSDDDARFFAESIPLVALIPVGQPGVGDK